MRIRRWMAAVLAVWTAGWTGRAAAGEDAAPAKEDLVREYTFGDLRVAAIADRRGRVPADAPLDLFLNIDRDALKKLIPADGMANAVNVFVVRRDDSIVLVDAGLGVKAGGRTLDGLAALGVKPEDVTDILMTHLHGDHCDGLHADGKPVFPNAKLRIAQAEIDYWTSDAEREKAPPARRGGFDGARAALKAMEGRIEAFAWTPLNDKSVPLPEDSAVRNVGNIHQPFKIEVFSLPGHTPGHAGFAFGGESNGVLFWGDVMHRVEVQAPRPDVAVTYDIDPATAVRARRDLLGFLDALGARKNIDVRVAGAHLPFPGIGAFRKTDEGDGYIFVPIDQLKR